MAMDDAALQKAKQLALKMLGQRARSEAQVRQKLKRELFAEDVIDAAIERMKELLLLNDQTLAQSRARGLMENGRLSPRAMVRKLCMQGISKETAQAAVDDAQAGTSEREMAARCLAKRRPAVDAQSDLAERMRAARWLSSRGFSEPVVRELLGI